MGVLTSMHHSSAVSRHCNQRRGKKKSNQIGKGKIGKGNEEKFRCNRYFHYLDCGDHFTCQNLLRCTI